MPATEDFSHSTVAPSLPPERRTGLLLTGGGARAAYQVGVLKAVARIRRECRGPGGNPFPVIAGTSAGAINAGFLACRSDEFDQAVDQLVDVWENFHADQVYRADSLGVIRTGARWLTMMSIGWMMARWRRVPPKSLLDNSPLGDLIERLIPTERLPSLLAQGHIDALAVTASGYGSGQHVTFYQSREPIEPWIRSQRLAVPTSIGRDHLLASSAIPFVFPSIRLPIGQHWDYYGDGSMRQSTPISPAIHLGAERVLVIGAGRMHEPATLNDVRAGLNEYPSLATIAGHALSNIFLDSLAIDVERLQRINNTLALLPPEARQLTKLRPVDLLVIAPTERLDDVASRHLHSLPVPVRSLLRGVGVQGSGLDVRGAALTSYLLFESGYTRELLTMGEHDTLARRDEVARFFGWDRRNRMRNQPVLTGLETMELG